jgi:hypothetical protein
MLYGMAVVGSVKGRLRGTPERLTLRSLRLMRAEHEVDHGKAVRELGWQPAPVEESIRAAARFSWRCAPHGGKRKQRKRIRFHLAAQAHS